MPASKIKIAMAQLLVEGGEPIRNLGRAEKLIEKAHQKKSDLVLLPECLDLAWAHPCSDSEALPIPGKYSDILCSFAKKYHIWICAGLTERERDKTYNSAILIDRDGQIVLKYRKINVLEMAQKFYSIGDTLGVVETEFGVIGVNICSDNYQNSQCIGHCLARMGAQLILSPSSWTVDHSIDEGQDPYGEKWIAPYSYLTKLYGISMVGTTSVGTITGGPFEGRKMVGQSLAMQCGEIVAQGQFREFSGELITTSVELKGHLKVGTAMSEMIEKRGHRFRSL